MDFRVIFYNVVLDLSANSTRPVPGGESIFDRTGCYAQVFYSRSRRGRLFQLFQSFGTLFLSFKKKLEHEKNVDFSRFLNIFCFNVPTFQFFLKLFIYYMLLFIYFFISFYLKYKKILEHWNKQRFEI